MEAILQYWHDLRIEKTWTQEKKDSSIDYIIRLHNGGFIKDNMGESHFDTRTNMLYAPFIECVMQDVDSNNPKLKKINREIGVKDRIQAKLQLDAWICGVITFFYYNTAFDRFIDILESIPCEKDSFDLFMSVYERFITLLYNAGRNKTEKIPFIAPYEFTYESTTDTINSVYKHVIKKEYYKAYLSMPIDISTNEHPAVNKSFQRLSHAAGCMNRIMVDYLYIHNIEKKPDDHFFYLPVVVLELMFSAYSATLRWHNNEGKDCIDDLINTFLFNNTDQ